MNEQLKESKLYTVLYRIKDFFPDKEQTKEKTIENLLEKMGNIDKIVNKEATFEIEEVNDEKIKDEWFFDRLDSLIKKLSIEYFMEERIDEVSEFLISLTIVSNDEKAAYFDSPNYHYDEEKALEIFNEIDEFRKEVVKRYRDKKGNITSAHYMGCIPTKNISIYMRKGAICRGNDDVVNIEQRGACDMCRDVFITMHKFFILNDCIFVDMEIDDGIVKEEDSKDRIKRLLEGY